MQTKPIVQFHLPNVSIKRLATPLHAINNTNTEKLLKIFPLICTRETTFPRAQKTWTKENPLHGQCTVVALVAQDILGGELIRASLKNDPDFKYMRFHYWNRLPDGREIDFTREQFGDSYPKNLIGEVRKRKEVFRIESVEERYKVLLHNLWNLQRRRQIYAN